MAVISQFDFIIKDLERKSEVLKAIAHPVRLCIVNGLYKQGSCNVSHMQFCLDIPQSTISQHISKLKSAKIIEGKRNGTEIQYYIVNEDVKKILDAIL